MAQKQNDIPVCKDCKYCVKERADLFGPPPAYSGRCHRLPPSVQGLYAFVLDIRAGWCGEFAPRGK